MFSSTARTRSVESTAESSGALPPDHLAWLSMAPILFSSTEALVSDLSIGGESLLIQPFWPQRSRPREPGLRGGHRLSGRTRSGQDGGACSGERFPLGAQSRERLRHRTLRCGKELSCIRAGAESLPRWPLRTLSAGGRLVRELALARADGSLRHLLARLARIDVLVIDDWGMAPLNETERREVWEICEDRYQTRSTLLTSQLPVSRWHEQIGDPSIADGILDRLVHNAHRIEMRGESMRKKSNPPNESTR